ncbi:MAG: ABC transporter ATP-binding protein [Dehalococcoidia bacterium]
MTSALVVEGVTKVYSGGVRANDGIDLRVEAGEVFGLLGPNGAGKTTLVSQIVGLLAPTSGTIHLGGVDLVADPAGARELCAYLPQAQLPIESLRAREAAELIGRMRGGSAREVRDRVGRLFESLHLMDWERQMGANLSGGVKRLVGFVMTAAWPRPLVILDEPTNDVDPVRRRLLWREIRALAAQGSAVLLVTHNVMEAERAVDRLAVVDHGRVLAQGTPAALKSADRGRLRLEIVLEPGAADPLLPPFAGDPVRAGRRLLVPLREEAAADAIEWVGGLVRDGVAEEYEIGAVTLEDTYVRLVDAEEMEAAGAGDR